MSLIRRRSAQMASAKPSTPLCFTAIEACNIGITHVVFASKLLNPTFQKSFDGQTWSDVALWEDYLFTGEQVEGDVISLAAGEKVYFRGNNPNGISSADATTYEGGFCKFDTSAKVAVSGNVMGLIDNGACETLVIPSYDGKGYGFMDLFAESKITTSPELPATTLTQGCYGEMFYSCTELTTSPELPATTLTQGCYGGMFEGCTALTKVPKLIATTLAQGCYNEMFKGCTALQVSDTLVSGSAEHEWRIPQSGAFANTYAQEDMFASCLGTRSSDDMAGVSGQSYTYYTQNEPV